MIGPAMKRGGKEEGDDLAPSSSKQMMSGDDATLREYAKLALEAAQDGDVDTFAKALKGFVRCCGEEPEGEEE